MSNIPPEDQLNKNIERRNTMAPTNPSENDRSGLFGISLLGGCLVSAAAVIGVPLLLIFFILVSGLNTFNGVIDGFRNMISPETTATVSSSETIVNSVQPLGQLVSVSAQLAKADIHVSVRSGVANACGRSANHVAQSTIEAGIDLTRLEEDDILYDEATETYTITLPQPQLTSCRMDFIRQYDRNMSSCGPAWDSVRVLAQYDGLIEFRNDAIAGGILDRARREADIAISNFIQLVTEQSVDIQFDENDTELIFPASCTPDTPENWAYDPENDSWSN